MTFQTLSRALLNCSPMTQRLPSLTALESDMQTLLSDLDRIPIGQIFAN